MNKHIVGRQGYSQSSRDKLGPTRCSASRMCPLLPPVSSPLPCVLSSPLCLTKLTRRQFFALQPICSHQAWSDALLGFSQVTLSLFIVESNRACSASRKRLLPSPFYYPNRPSCPNLALVFTATLLIPTPHAPFLAWEPSPCSAPIRSNVFSCAQIDVRKARKRKLGTLDEKSTSSGIAELYAR